MIIERARERERSERERERERERENERENEKERARERERVVYAIVFILVGCHDHMRRKKHLLATSSLACEENLSPDGLCQNVVVRTPDSANLCGKVCG
jgi:hypothetical protein